MKYIITNIVKRYTQKTNATPSLGRWRIVDCEKKTFSKVDWSNEDHCGVCYTPATSTRQLTAITVARNRVKSIVCYDPNNM